MKTNYKTVPGFPAYVISETGAVRKGNIPVPILAGNSYLLDDAEKKRKRMTKQSLIELAWGEKKPETKKVEEKPEPSTKGVRPGFGAEKFVAERAARGKNIRLPQPKAKVDKPKEQRASVPIPKLDKPKKDYPQAVQDILKKDVTKSDKIRALDKKGLSRTEIAGLLGIRYQHASNVLNGDKKKKPITKTK